MKRSTTRDCLVMAMALVTRTASKKALTRRAVASLVSGAVLLFASVAPAATMPGDPLGGDGQWIWQNPLPQGNTLLDVYFIDSNNGFAVGPSGTILRTTDGGHNWDILESGTVRDLWGVSFADANTGMVVGNFGVILRTTDGGDSWTVQRDEPSGVLFSVSFTDADIGTAVGAKGSGVEGLIVRTTDGGVNWVEQESGTTHWLRDIFFTDTDNGTAIGEGGTILTTSDGGATWVHQTSGTTARLNGVSFSDAQTGTIVGSGSTILRTTDGGSSWFAQTSPVSSDLHDVSFVDATFGIAVGPVGLVLSTTDGGSTWVQETSGSLKIFNGVSMPDADNGIIVGFGGEILTTADGGSTWTIESSGATAELHGVAFSEPSTGTIVGAFGTILRTTDGGSTWNSQESGTFDSLNELFFTDPGTGTVVGGDGTILGTTDGGESWVERVSNSEEILFGLSFADANTGLAVGAQGTILRTTDGGVTWNPAESGTESFLFGVSFGDADTATAVGLGGTIVRSTDGGVNWDAQVSGTTLPLRGVSFTDADTGTVAGNGGTILRTTDGGKSWQMQTSGTTEHLWGVSFSDANHGATVGMAGTLLRTTDGGESWVTEPSPTPNRFFNVFLLDAHDATVVGDVGAVLKNVSTGEPGEPELGFEPASLDFGQVPVGDTSAPQTAMLQNTGDTDATGVTLSGLPDSGFEADTSACGDTLPAGASCAVSVTFTPAAPGPATATLHAASDEGAAADLELFGEGVGAKGPVADVSPDAFTFELPAGGSDGDTLNIGNVGDADLTWSLEEAEAVLTGSGMPYTYGLAWVPELHAPVGADRASAARAQDAEAAGLRAGRTDDALRTYGRHGGRPLQNAVSPVVLAAPQPAAVDDLTEGFDDITQLPGAGWAMINNSEPVGATSWFQGNETIFPSHEGAPDAYIAANFDSTGGAGDISNWLLTPELTIVNGTELCFWTRTTPLFEEFLDRLEVRMSVAGDSTDVGDTAESVGDFTELLLTIEPDLELPNEYPEEWTQFCLTVRERSRRPVTGRFAFRYWVTDSGPDGTNGDYIGIDTVSVEQPGGMPPGDCDDPVDVPWLDADPTSGTTPPGGSEPVGVTVDATDLEAGEYTARLCVTTNDPEASLVEVPVHLTVTEDGPPVLDVEPDSLSVTLPQDEIETEPLTLSNLGGEELDWAVMEDDIPSVRALETPVWNSVDTESSHRGSPSQRSRRSHTAVGVAGALGCILPDWVGVEPTSGSLPPGGEQVVEVTFDASGLDPSVEEAELCLASNDPAHPLTVVPLQLTVAGTARVSLASDGSEGNDASFAPALSADGRLVAFDSVASNLVAGDANGARDIFVHDRSSGSTTRVSVASDGSEANADSVFSALSADGRYVAFQSVASDLVPGDTNSASDVFVHDRETGATERVSVASDGSEGNDASFFVPFPAISADGRYVTFESEASNLVPDDMNDVRDVFVHDRETGITERVSVASDGSEGNETSWVAVISADGRYVAFQSFASNFVPGDANDTSDIFVHDRDTGTTERVSIASDGSEANGRSLVPAISADGRHVAFDSLASNLVPDDTNAILDIFVHDLDTGVTERVSVASDGTEGNADSPFPALSADGRHVVFASVAANLVPGDTNGTLDIFLHDRMLGITERVSVASDGGEANGLSLFPAIDAAGRAVAFESVAANLVPGDTNGVRDIFVASLGDAAENQGGW